MSMSCLEAFRLAVAEMGDVSPGWLAWFMERKYGVKIEPGVIPIFRAAQEKREHRMKLRQAARRVA